jgi:hypothetical protein
MMERPAKGGTGAIQAYLHDGGLIYSPPHLNQPHHRSDCAPQKPEWFVRAINAPPRGLYNVVTVSSVSLFEKVVVKCRQASRTL